MENYRSDHFNYFSNQNNEEKQKENRKKKIWFWIKIILYVLLFGITLTGCVQSCVIKSSNYTGSGVELYTKKEKVVPHVLTFKAENNLTEEDEKILERNSIKSDELLDKNDFFSFKLKEEANFFLSPQKYANELKNLQEQAGNEYGYYQNFNTAIQLLDKDEEFWKDNVIYKNDDDKYLFAVRPQKDGKGENTFVYGLNTKNNLKRWRFMDVNFNFDYYFKYDENKKKYVINTEDEDIQKGQFKDFIILPEKKKSKKKETEEEKEKKKFYFKKDISTLSVNDFYSYDENYDRHGYGRFRRDIFEAIAKETFEKDNNFYSKHNEKIISDYDKNNTYDKNRETPFSWLSSHIVECIKNKEYEKIELDPHLFFAFKKYNNAIANYIKQVELSPDNKLNPIRQQMIESIKIRKDEYEKLKVEYQDSSKSKKEKKEIKKSMDTIEEDLEKLNETLARDNVLQPQYIAAAPNSSYGVLFEHLQDVPFANPIPQRVIAGWGSAWRHGPFYGIFVYPLAWMTHHLSNGIPYWKGWGTIIVILIVTILIRGSMLGVTFRQTVNQSKQEDLKDKKAKIDAKYVEFKDNKQMKARQQQEVASLYKKHGLNPLDAFATMIISIPFFIGIWRVIQGLPEIKSTVWLTMSFAETSWKRLFFHKEFAYLGLIIVAASSQLLSQFMPRILNHKKFKERTNIEEVQALKKQNRSQKVMAIMFLVMTLIFSAGVQVYWIISALWSIGQSIGIHYFKKSNYYRRKYLKK